MAVEQNGFDLGQHRIIAVDVRPPRLHHSDLGIGEVMDAFQQKVGWRNKIGVKDGNEFALRRFQSFGKGAGLVALTIVAVQVGHRMSKRGVAIHQNACHLDGLVGRVVQQLDVELFSRIVEPAHGVEEPVHHILLVKDRQLYGDARQIIELEMSRWFRRLVLLVLVIKIDHPVAVRAIRSQDDQDDEIGDQQRQIKGIDLVKPLKSFVQKMLAKVGHQAFGGEDQGQGLRGRSERQIHELSWTMNQKEESSPSIVPDRSLVVGRWSLVVSPWQTRERLTTVYFQSSLVGLSFSSTV